MKDQTFFESCFAKATAETPEVTKNREFVILHKAVIACIREGEYDQGYVRNALGYNADLPSKVFKEKVGGKNVFFTKTELFAKVWAAANAEVRILTANATAREVWGFSFIGATGVNGLMTPYCAAIEKESDQIVFVASKDDAIFLESLDIAHEKTTKQGQKVFSLPIADFTVLLDKKFNQNVSEKHDAFAELYRAKLSKYTKFRKERMSLDITDMAATYETW
jgi:hypothetical protein